MDICLPLLAPHRQTSESGTSMPVNWKGATGSIASSADGAVLAFGTINEGVRLWNVPMRCEIGRFPADEHSFSHLGIALAPDGRILAANGEDGTIVLWDLERKTAIRRLKGHSNGASCLAFLPDGRTLASGGHDSTLRLWSTVWGEQLALLTNHTDK